MHKVQVWDIVVRATHWVVALGFFFSLNTTHAADLSHEIIGLVMLGALLLRIVWGFIGTYHARYRNFAASPDRALEYLIDLADGEKPRYLGHNPAGAVMVVAMHVALLLLGVTGLLLYLDGSGASAWGSSGLFIKILHNTISTLVLVMVVMHITGVLWMSWIMRESLPWSMLTGNKRDHDPDGPGPGVKGR